MDVTAFYGTVSALCFTLLGLWWVACQARNDWLVEPGGRRMAYAVSLHFLLPGAMSLLSMVAPDVAVLWRATFTVAGLAGLAGVVLLAATVRSQARNLRVVAAIHWLGVPLYAAVVAVALLPGLPAALATGLSALQLEAILLTLLVVMGVQAAWLLTFLPSRE